MAVINKQLLTEYLPFAYKVINESKNLNEGRFIIRGVFQRANAKNQNGRIYPREVLERESKAYQTLISERRALGELDHPESPTVNLRNVSHNILKLEWENDDLIGELEVLTTPMGNILRELLKSGIKVGISSRGMGSVKNIREGGVEVQDDFQLLCFDVVSNPSTQGAFLHENYNVEKALKNSKFARVDSLIYDFLNEIK